MALSMVICVALITPNNITTLLRPPVHDGQYCCGCDGTSTVNHHMIGPGSIYEFTGLSLSSNSIQYIARLPMTSRGSYGLDVGYRLWNISQLAAMAGFIMQLYKTNNAIKICFYDGTLFLLQWLHRCVKVKSGKFIVLLKIVLNKASYFVNCRSVFAIFSILVNND